MQTGPSLLSLLAAAFYILVAISCVLAGTSAASRRQPLATALPWGLIALLFISMAISRYFEIEDTFRNEMRSALQADGTYEMRREYQRPMAAIAVVFGSTMAFWLLYKVAQSASSRRVLALRMAKTAALSLVTLVLLRIISLHPVDGLLYGPLKLNWVIDIGASMIVLAAATSFVVLVKGLR